MVFMVAESSKISRHQAWNHETAINLLVPANCPSARMPDDTFAAKKKEKKKGIARMVHRWLMPIESAAHGEERQGQLLTFRHRFPQSKADGSPKKWETFGRRPNSGQRVKADQGCGNPHSQNKSHMYIIQLDILKTDVALIYHNQCRALLADVNKETIFHGLQGSFFISCVS